MFGYIRNFNFQNFFIDSRKELKSNLTNEFEMNN